MEEKMSDNGKPADPSTTPKRRPGAQPGNTNALKHGFYSRQLNVLDRINYDAQGAQGLQDEITMLRLYIRRVLALASRTQTLQESLNTIRAISLAATSLTRLLKAHKLLYGTPNELEDLINQAIAEVAEEMDLSI
jgi:hypothetical protein